MTTRRGARAGSGRRGPDRQGPGALKGAVWRSNAITWSHLWRRGPAGGPEALARRRGALTTPCWGTTESWGRTSPPQREGECRRTWAPCRLRRRTPRPPTATGCMSALSRTHHRRSWTGEKVSHEPRTGGAEASRLGTERVTAGGRHAGGASAGPPPAKTRGRIERASRGGPLVAGVKRGARRATGRQMRRRESLSTPPPGRRGPCAGARQRARRAGTGEGRELLLKWLAAGAWVRGAPPSPPTKSPSTPLLGRRGP